MAKSRKSMTTIDLNGIHNGNIKSLVTRKIEAHKKSKTELTFLTGMTMIDIVTDVLKSYDLQYTIVDVIDGGIIKTML